MIERARKLRRERTGVERILWARLRLFKELGYHFRQQYSIANYVVDFACISAGLVIEIDGPSHDFQLPEDAQRQAFLERLEWTVLRFSADEVLRDADAVADGIYVYLQDNPKPHPNPPRLAGRGTFRSSGSGSSRR